MQWTIMKCDGCDVLSCDVMSLGWLDNECNVNQLNIEIY
jgi:hypothetical protein